MTPFRRVDAAKAGPRALGILVPPGEDTLVIIRPRALIWDLLPARWTGDCQVAPAFCRFRRDDAVQAARQLYQFLERCVAQSRNPLETFGDDSGRRVQVWLRTEDHVWIVCRRAPGEPYRPAVFTSPEEASHAGQQLIPFLWPAADAQQELYFNTQLIQESLVKS